MRLALASALLLLVTTVARADEIAVIGTHSLSGTRAGRTYSGSVFVSTDATFRGERRFADGSREAIAGAVRIDEKTLVLTFARGIAGALAGASATERAFVRADDDHATRWRFSDGTETEELSRPHESESKLDTVKRALHRPLARWLFQDNRGIVDPKPGFEILRSKQPSPDDVVTWVEKRHVKTILSLNGPLDDDAWYYPAGEPAQKVNLGKFMEARVRHEFVGMSASRAPTDEELVQIFRTLLDDSKKPILIHCRGGSDRTGIVSALYQIEFMGWSKERARAEMRAHGWMAVNGTEVMGAYLDLYQPGHIRKLLGR